MQEKLEVVRPAPVHKAPKVWLRWAAVILALAGWWLSFDLFRLSYGGGATNPWLAAQCGGVDAPQGDCLSVLRSDRAWLGRTTLPDGRQSMGFPWSALGMAYFSFVAIWYMFVGPPTRGRAGWHILISLVVLAGALASLDLVLVMKNDLHRWCQGCLATHVINGLLALLTLIAAPWGRPRLLRVERPGAGLALATLTAGIFCALTHYGFIQWGLRGAYMSELDAAYSKIVTDPRFIRWRYESQPVVTFEMRPDEAFLGAPDAPNTVVAFIDFQCTACRRASNLLQEVAQKHPGQLRVVFRHFPQDPACNATFEGGSHASACVSARAAEAARALGGAQSFHKMRSLLYERQADLELNRFDAWAKEIGLDAQAFARAMDSSPVRSTIDADVKLGADLGLRAIPVLYLNGRKLEGWQSPQTWDELLGGAAAANSSGAVQDARQ